MNKHTPAPWGVTGFDGGKMAEVRVDGKLACLMACFGKKATEEDEANLRLIAAAPDLLFALQEFLRNPGGDYTEEIAEQAIAKATGQ